MSLMNTPHTRYNPLTGESVLVSPHRTKRPWQGRHEQRADIRRPRFEPDCYLCPGNARAGGKRNPDYTGTFVFENDFPALLPDSSESEKPESPPVNEALFRSEAERGICKVICFSPRHDLSLSLMEPEQITAVIDTWSSEYISIAAEEYISYVQIFENKGPLMGCSNPHPHGQIWANETIPYLPNLETKRLTAYREGYGSCLLCDYIRAESEKEERVVSENGSFIALVPYWAVWPFELMLLPKRHIPSIDELKESEKQDLSAIIRDSGKTYDGVFETEFPYSMGIHQRPTDGGIYRGWHLHFHYYPPLLRSAEVRKFMVGYEMLGMPQRDITPESAAQRLREVAPEGKS